MAIINDIWNRNYILEKYKDLSEKDKSLLFYYSLMDSSMFNEPGFNYSSDKFSHEIKRFFRKKFKIKTSEINDADLDRYFYTNLFTSKINNILISTELGRRLKTSANPSIKWGDNEVDCVLPHYKFFIETKRVYSAGDIGDYIIDNIEKYRNGDITYKDITIKKVLINLIFISDNENEEKIFHKRTTMGYHSIFSKFSEKGYIPKFLEFYTSYFYKGKNINEFFDSFCYRIKSLNTKK